MYLNTDLIYVNETDLKVEDLDKSNIVLSIPRDPINRSETNPTYVLERQLLDECNIDSFTHKVFRVTTANSSLIIGFTPDRMVVA